MPQPPEVFFEPDAVGTGQRLYLHHRFGSSTGTPQGAVLYLHPFAEEMNKSRRMAALHARALAAAGFAVLQVDLLGCGDSSGDFGDATWESWQADVVAAAQWLRHRHRAPLWLWGLRAGCLLAAAAAPAIGPCHFLFWQPPISGRPVLQQFLRLKAAALLADGGGKGVLNELRAELAAGEAVQVAGYRLHPALARGLEAAALAPTTPVAGGADGPRRVVCLEVSTAAAASPSPAVAGALAAWIDAGYAVDGEVVRGPMFWQTTEIEDAPALVEASVRMLLRPRVTA